MFDLKAKFLAHTNPRASSHFLTYLFNIPGGFGGVFGRAKDISSHSYRQIQQIQKNMTGHVVIEK